MHWSNVSSNTKVKYFTSFLNDSTSFAYEFGAEQYGLNKLDPEDTCTLKYVVEPLQWVSDQLVKQVEARSVTIHSMSLTQRVWSLKDASQTYKAHNVILATGAVPSNLNYPGVEIILENAVES